MDLTPPDGTAARLLRKAAENDLLRTWLWSPVLGWSCRLLVGRDADQLVQVRRYAIVDGSVWLIADPDAAWYRKLLDQPDVTVQLPGRTITGRAHDVLDADLAATVRREIALNSGLWPEERFPARPPVVRIDADQPLSPGPHDPGGAAWVLPHVVAPVIAVAAVLGCVLRRRTGRG